MSYVEKSWENKKIEHLIPHRAFVVEKKGLNQRQVELKLFCDRMPDLDPRTIAVAMSMVATEELHETYEAINKRARNFTALWKWHFMPTKKK